MSLLAGTRLGPYEVLSAIGAGGMGEVYRARDTRLDRQVAIKVIRMDADRPAGFRERFSREAKAISALDHPHICALYDVGEDSGLDYLVIPVERDILQSGWLLGEQVIAKKAAAVAVRHGEGRVVLIGFRPQHRDQTHGTFKLVFNALLNVPRDRPAGTR